MQQLSIPTPRKIAQVTIAKRIEYTEENERFFRENDLEEITNMLIVHGFDPLSLSDHDEYHYINYKLIEIYIQRSEWEADGNCTLCGEYMIVDNSGDEYNRADFAHCSNGCL